MQLITFTTEKRFLEESNRGLRNKIECIINGYWLYLKHDVFFVQNIIVIHMYSNVIRFTQMKLKSLICSGIR